MVASTASTRGIPSLFSRLSLRPSASAISSSGSSNGTLHPRITLTQTRTQATTRRTTKRLRRMPVASAPKPHSSAVSHSAHPTPTPTMATSISFDPPSSAPTPFHTPALFLPANDPRRKLHASAATADGSSVGARYAAVYNPYVANPAMRLPPQTRARDDGEKKYHVTEEELREMRRLRAEDPTVWTRAALAKKFRCSELFVGIGAPTVQEKKDLWHARRKEDGEKVGVVKRKARADRNKRKELWFQDA